MQSNLLMQLQEELRKAYNTIEKQNRSLSSYKGHFTKLKNKSC